jgi:hypothetical protein
MLASQSRIKAGTCSEQKLFKPGFLFNHMNLKGKDKLLIPFEYLNAYDRLPNKTPCFLYQDVVNYPDLVEAYSQKAPHDYHFQMGKASSHVSHADRKDNLG